MLEWRLSWDQSEQIVNALSTHSLNTISFSSLALFFQTVFLHQVGDITSWQFLDSDLPKLSSNVEN